MGIFPPSPRARPRVSILGRTAVNVLGQYRGTLETLLSQGCNIRILFHPTSTSSPYLYGSTPEAYEENLRAARTHLRQLNRTSSSGRLEIKEMRHPPTMGLVIAEKSSLAESSVRVQFYFYHARVGRDRPILPIFGESQWYNVFLRESQDLWNGGTDWLPD